MCNRFHLSVSHAFEVGMPYITFSALRQLHGRGRRRGRWHRAGYGSNRPTVIRVTEPTSDRIHNRVGRPIYCLRKVPLVLWLTCINRHASSEYDGSNDYDHEKQP
jgi:hypothetical protein